jgi:hypothetical protein
MSDINSILVCNIPLIVLYRVETVLTDCQSFPDEILVEVAQIWGMSVEHGVRFGYLYYMGKFSVLMGFVPNGLFHHL